MQEAAADELEEAYRSEVWNPTRGRLSAQKGIPLQAAKVDLQTLTNEAKVGLYPSPVSDLPHRSNCDGKQVSLCHVVACRVKNLGDLMVVLLPWFCD